MTIRETMDYLFANDHIHQLFHRTQIIDMVLEAFPGTNKPSERSIMPPDYCYNSINAGIPFSHHLFKRLFKHQDKGMYEVLGKNHPFEGDIFWQEKGKKEKKVGEWRKGSSEPIFYEEYLKKLPKLKKNIN